MGGMLPAEPTKLFNFQTTGHHLFILGRGIIFPLTISASQLNNISHKPSNFPLGNGKTTYSDFHTLINSKISAKIESPRSDLNRWPLPYQGSAPPLSYVGKTFFSCSLLPSAQTKRWSGKPDSNRRPSAWKADALAN